MVSNNILSRQLQFLHNTKVRNFVLVSTLFIGIWFRFDKPALIAFQFSDELRDYHQVVKVIKGQQDMPIYGPTFLPGGKQVPGNAFYLLTALPYLVTTHPLAGALFFYLLISIGLIISYFAVKKLFNENLAVITTIFYALSPWAIFATRKYHHPYLVPFFTALLLLLLALVFKEKKKYFYPLILPVAVLAMQIHTVAVVFVPAVIVISFFYRKDLNWQVVALGIAGSILLYAPYIIHELQNDFAYTKTLFNSIGGGLSVRPDFLKVFLYPFVFAAGEISYFFKHQTMDMMGNSSPVTVFLILGIISVFTMCFYTLKQLFSFKRLKTIKDQNPGVFILLIIVGCMFLFHLIRRQVPHPHYLYGLFPVPFMLPAYFFFIKIKEGRASYVFRILQKYSFIPIIIMYVFLTVLGFQYVSNVGGTEGHFKTNLGDQLSAINYMSKESGNNFKVVGEKGKEWSKKLGPVYMFKTMIEDFPGYKKPDKKAFHYNYIWVKPKQSPNLKMFKQALSYKKFRLLYVFRIK